MCKLGHDMSTAEGSCSTTRPSVAWSGSVESSLASPTRRHKAPTPGPEAEGRLGPEVSSGATQALGKLDQCETVILLLTKRVLYQPECLYAAYCALVEDKLLIPINIERGGYDYATAAALLDRLEDELAVHHPHVLNALREMLQADWELPPSVAHVQQTLQGALPNLIAISWQPQSGRNHTASVISDIAARVLQWQQAHGERSALNRKILEAKKKQGGISQPSASTRAFRGSVMTVGSLAGSLAEASTARLSGLYQQMASARLGKLGFRKRQGAVADVQLKRDLRRETKCGNGGSAEPLASGRHSTASSTASRSLSHVSPAVRIPVEASSLEEAVGDPVAEDDAVEVVAVATLATPAVNAGGGAVLSHVVSGTLEDEHSRYGAQYDV